MYSALPQKYNYGKGLSVSLCVNILLFIILMQTHGSILSNSSRSHIVKHKISVKRYKIIHITAEKASSSDDKQVNQIEKKKIEKTYKKPIEVPNPQKLVPQKPISQRIEEERPILKADTIQEKSSVAMENIAAEVVQEKIDTQTSEQSEDLEPVTEASHFGLNNEPPLYPIISIQLGESGEVVIDYIVSKDGEIVFAEVVQSSGHLRLDRLALIEFKKWKFTPAKNIMGQAIDSRTKTITFAFDIKNQGIVIK